MQWGHSLAIRIPSVFAKQIRIKRGEIINLDMEKGRIIISKSEKRLEDLMAKVTPKNMHKEVNMGDPVGKEIW